MATAEHDLEKFIRFVQQRIESGEAGASLDELFDLWRHENPSDDLHATDVAAIAASIEDFKNGERGTMAGEHSAALRRQFGLGDQ
ncbi:MAG: hypothetical protein AB7O59_16810 [Pirellulales bacterium]